MPPEPKKDANDALRDGKLDQWLKELVEVPELARSVDDFCFEPRSSLGIREPDWLIKGIIEKATLAAIVGESGSGKSFLALDLACCIATGTNWHGRAVNYGDVCYLAGSGPGRITTAVNKLRSLSPHDRLISETVENSYPKCDTLYVLWIVLLR